MEGLPTTVENPPWEILRIGPIVTHAQKYAKPNEFVEPLVSIVVEGKYSNALAGAK
jgi:hypothetical protein